MGLPAKTIATLAVLTAGAAGLGACGTEKVDVPGASANVKRGATLFAQRCSGCHTLAAAGTEGSAPNAHSKLRTNGPNFDQRCESVAQTLYAIANGGFSGAIMPQGIVVGADAQNVARFVSKYSGTKRKTKCPS